MKSPTISAITASFNAAAYVGECLASVQSQQTDENPLDHIVIDGASTDGTLEILQNWNSQQNAVHSQSTISLQRIERSKNGQAFNQPATDSEKRPGFQSAIHCPPYVFRYISEPDQGQADAFNKGVAMAHGEWICWLNADDKLAPGAIASFQKALVEYPNAEVIYGHVQFIDEESKPVKISYHLPFHYPLVLNGCYVPPSSGTFFRRDLLQREPLDIEYHYVMDVEWFLRCGRQLRALLVDEVFSHFRISADAKTSEMIRSGQITDRHREERENYRRKHVYSQWQALTEYQARLKFEHRQKLYRILYKAMKMRYALRYLLQPVSTAK